MRDLADHGHQMKTQNLAEFGYNTVLKKSERIPDKGDFNSVVETTKTRTKSNTCEPGRLVQCRCPSKQIQAENFNCLLRSIPDERGTTPQAYKNTTECKTGDRGRTNTPTWNRTLSDGMSPQMTLQRREKGGSNYTQLSNGQNPVRWHVTSKG